MTGSRRQGAADRGKTDEAGADTPRSRRNVRPDVERRTAVRRQLRRLAFGAVFLSGTVYALFGEDGLADRMRLSREYRRLEADVAVRKERIRALEDAKTGLAADPMSRERIAREQLGYIRPGEVVFLLPE